MFSRLWPAGWLLAITTHWSQLPPWGVKGQLHCPQDSQRKVTRRPSKSFGLDKFKGVGGGILLPAYHIDVPPTPKWCSVGAARLGRPAHNAGGFTITYYSMYIPTTRVGVGKDRDEMRAYCSDGEV